MPASIGVNLRVTGHCSQGGRKYMEDLFSVAYQQTEDERDLEYAFFGIYDGHGGSEAAAFAKEHLMDSIVKQRQFWSDNDEDVLKAIRNGYILTHLNMWKELEKWPKTVTGLPSTAGTTASVAFIRRGKIYIGHVGDSAIVLGYQKDGSDEWATKPLTCDHKPESTAEIERIQRCGGKVVSKAGVPRVVWYRPRPGHKGPIKKTTPMDEIPFLAVARSLGDLWSYNSFNDEFIVSPDPDVGVLNIDPAKFRCIIFGTDGLWNMISPEDAISLVQATEKHNEAALVSGSNNQSRDWLNPSKSLVDHALERWANTKMRADNTSVVTLILDPPGPPRATVLKSRSTAQKPQTTPTPPPQNSTTTAPPKPEDSKPHREENSSTKVPQNGLTIMTRYSDVDKPAASPDSAEKTPLPPCSTLHTRYSLGISDESKESNESEESETINNYGNPSESYYMVRLLNRSRVVNTLSSVFDEIINKQIIDGCPENTTTVPTSLEGAGDTVAEKSETNENVINETGDGKKEHDSGIQINEVSSSSPNDHPKPRGRRPKDGKAPHPPSNDRVLRSHDSADTKPQSRQPAPKAPPMERVVILSRRVNGAEEDRRSTRSQVSTVQKTQNIQGCGECASAAAGNEPRGPGLQRAAPAARRAPTHPHKENLGVGRRRVRTRDADEAGRARRGEARLLPGSSPSPAPAHPAGPPPRALRSRNEAEPAPKRKCPEALAPPKPVPEPLQKVKAISKRASGPWAPALALRNRLRRRLAK